MHNGTKSKRSPEGEAFTDLVLELFRLNGSLLAAGDRLVESLGLTSTRWQVLGAACEKPLPVAQIARNMGLTRQSVQRTANALEATGFIVYDENPDHRRAKLVRLTDHARKVLETVDQRQVQWANRISEGVLEEELTKALTVMRNIRERLDRDRANGFFETQAPDGSELP